MVDVPDQLDVPVSGLDRVLVTGLEEEEVATLACIKHPCSWIERRGFVIGLVLLDLIVNFLVHQGFLLFYYWSREFGLC